MKYSTNSGLQAIIRAISHYGIDAEELLKKENIVVPAATDGHEHIPPVLIEQLFELALRDTGDPAFPLRVAEYISPATFGEFSIGLLTSNSLRNFLERFARYYPYISTSQRLRLVQQQDRVILVSFFAEGSIKPETRSVWVEVTLAFVLRFMRLMGQPDYSPLRVDLVRPQPQGVDERYNSFFGVSPHFGASRNTISFSTQDLDIQLPNGGLDLAAEYEKKIVKKMAEFSKDNLPLQVHAYLLEELPLRPLSKENVASHFAMSPKTFQNKLQERGTTYQVLLDNSRRELAEFYLSFPATSLAEVAAQLGYSDQSNFCRAYKRWTGRLPREA